MSIKTLTSGSSTALYMPLTMAGIDCPAPVLQNDFDNCRIPGGAQLWDSGGFYSPGLCFVGYIAMCTQTRAASNEWPVQPDETVVRCIPSGYDCNPETEDQRYATTDFGGTILSVPAFEIRWRNQDLETGASNVPPTNAETLPSAPAIPTFQTKSETQSGITTSVATTTTPSNRASPTSSSIATSSKQQGLSAGSIAAITIGATLGSICLLLAFFYKLRQRTRHANKDGSLQLELPGGNTALIELASSPPEPQELAVESQTVPRSHMAIAELPTPMEMIVSPQRNSESRSPDMNPSFE